jgi:hypothetical protein
MTDAVKSMTVSEWRNGIATRSASTADNVEKVLSGLGIRPQSVLPRSRNVNVRSVKLLGAKLGPSGGARFEFEWAGLEEGLWALMTEGNSKGKSSVLAAVRAALQGRFPGRLKDDIWLWLSEIEVRFRIDRTEYCVSLKKETGEKSAEAAMATVTRQEASAAVELYGGPADDQLETAMGDLFMRELGFDSFRAYRAPQNAVVEHGWPAMSAALFISGAGPAIFGDNLEDGLPLRLMQMFIGLPWVSTYTAISSAYKLLYANKAEGGRSAAEQARVDVRVGMLEKQLDDKKKQLASLPDRRALRARLDNLDTEVSKFQAEVTTARVAGEVTRLEIDAAKAGHDEARRLLQQAEDEGAAGYVFRKLKPVCCPACESKFEATYFTAAEPETCGLCHRPDPGQGNESAVDLTALKAAVADASAAYKKALKKNADAESTLAGAVASRDDAVREMRSVEFELAGDNQADELAREIAILEGRIEELRQPVESTSPAAQGPADQLTILKAAEKVTKEAMEALQAELLRDVEAELFGFAQEFGVSNLESLSLKPNRMDVKQGGADLTYGKLNDGEKLRMRIAAALAVLKIARKRGYGRHPGILVLDSPAATEMSHDDFAALIGAIHKAVAEIAGVQILVGAVIRSELEPVVPMSNRKEAKGNATLF